MNQETELREVMDSTLIQPSEDTNEIKFSVGKLLCLLEAVLPILWIYAACEASYIGTLLHMVFIFFYSIGMNSVRIMTNSLYKWPFLFVLLSQVYSALYVIAELSIYYMPQNKKVKITPILKLLDLFNKEDKNLFKTPYFVLQIVLIIINFIYLTSRSTFILLWYKQSRFVIIKHLMVLIRPIFLFTLAVLVTSCNSLKLSFMPVIFALTIISFSLLSLNLANWITWIYWIIYILADFAFIAYKDQTFKEPVGYNWVPRWAVVSSAATNLLFLGMIIGVNRNTTVHTIRLFKNATAPTWFMDIIPYVVLISCGVFCICRDAWESFGVLALACFTTLFGLKFLQKASRFVLTALAIVYCYQIFDDLARNKTEHHPKYNLVICTLQAISAVFVHCNPMIRTNPNHQNTESQVIKVIAQYIITIIFIGLVLLNAIFSSQYHYLASDFPLFCMILILWFKLFYNWVWAFLNVITFVSTSIYFINPLLKKKINIEWLFDITVTKDPKVMFSKVWPFLVLFILTAILRYYYRQPPMIVVKFSKTVGVFVCLCLSCIYIQNSIFTVLYQLLIIGNLFLYKFHSVLMIINSASTSCHLLTILLFSYEQIKPYIEKKELILKLFGIIENPNVFKDIMLPNIILILYSVFASISRKYDEPNGNTKIPHFLELIINNLWAITIKFSFYLFWSSIFLVVIVSKGVSIVGSLMIMVLGVLKVTGVRTNAIGILLYIIFIADVLVVTAIDITNTSDSVKKVFKLIGPLVNTSTAKFANVIVCLCAFLNMSHFRVTEISEYVKLVGNSLSSILLSAVELTLSIMAIQESNILSIFGVVLVFVLLIKPNLSLCSARLITIILTIILGYVLTFKIITINTKNDWMSYLLLHDVKMVEIFYIFLTMFALCLFCEYGSLTGSLGPTFLTAYYTTICSIVAVIISLTGTTYLILVHSLLLIINLVYTSHNKYFHIYSFKVAIFYCFGNLLMKSFRPLRIFTQSETEIDRIFGFRGKDNFQWIFVYWLEFLLNNALNSPSYLDIYNKEKRRCQYRKDRQIIIQDLFKLDQEYCDEYFNKELDRLKAGVYSLNVTNDTTSESPDLIQFEAMVNRQDDIQNNDVPVQEAENYNQQQNQENQTNEQQENAGNDPNNAVVVPTSTRVFYISLLKWIFGLIWGVVVRLVDRLTVMITYFTDINLEPRVHTGFLNKLKEMMETMVSVYKSDHVLQIPDQYTDFVKTIPLSFLRHFQIFEPLELKKVTPEERFSVFYYYLKVISRQIIPALLLVMAIFYPMEERSIFGILFFFLSLTTLSFNIQSYLPFVILSIVYMLLRCILGCYGVKDIISSFLVEDKYRKIQISKVLGLDLNKSQKAYLYIVFILSVASQHFTFNHPPQIRNIKPSQTVKKTLSEKIKERINMKSFVKYHFNKLCFTIDITAFILSLFSYLGWTISSSANSMLSGSATITYDFVFFLMGNFLFILLIQWVIISEHKSWLFSFNLLYSIFTFVYMSFLIPVFTNNGCFEHFTFWLFFFLRLTSEMILSINCLFGFCKVPPSIGNPNPLVVYVKILIVNAVPFLFEFIYLIKWLASTTSLDLFDFFIISQMKSKFMKQLSYLKLWPLDNKKKSHIIGYLFILALFALLFVPFIVMMSSSSTSKPNPVKVASVSIGIYGLPEIWSGTVLPDESNIFSDTMQREILNLNDPMLDAFYSNNKKESQYFQYPDITLTNWQISDSSANYALNKMTKFIPYVNFKFTTTSPTTKLTTDQITITKTGNNLDEEQIKTLKEIINCTLNTQEPENLSLNIENLIPLYFTIPLSDEATFINKYYFNLSMQFMKSQSSGQFYWLISVNKTEDMPDFVEEGALSSAVYCKPSYNAVIGSLLTSTGGFYGLYVFIIFTCGTFVRSFITSFFQDLWIDRMGNPEIFLNVILAIEAHRNTGDLPMEYATATMILNTARSLHNMAKIGKTVKVKEA
ncbi:hypothetical protein TVAG_223490 [Trichomonas vaginalis G3]|uniref:Piezo non-specific cation channel cap domain-containing protein n=1 Tax=Trichomonas vaginalis (strain ATCC PRA-98 / G3) TaxID=412133 RepID=A2EJ54_TRIV3|nr:Piezo-type mechanosensitive ion channel component family [Trichomonas vaginalis G3]EAY07286.1 hypothetical protein TVAG_223490 [Trichomonas vaginalis G3]KAI5550459.1 Piezo-type mechanosensitive ion channel component family [Trichomonas vaginalis G3]|eukprot:XP_001319509.1 hypothetical protein [Trichomonas vaginalis G3]